MYLLLHEGGHALFHALEREPITNLYAHPFIFSGYVRPITDWNNVWSHVSGTALAVPASLIITLMAWKHRSPSNLPLVMLFPFSAFLHGIGFINLMIKTGDFYNIKVVTGLPAYAIYLPLSILFLVGVLSLVSLFPLLGLEPHHWRSLLVIPASMVLYGLFSSLVAHLFVPGSSIDVRYQMAEEIIDSANPLLGLIFGGFLGLFYFTIYRSIAPRIPARLKTGVRILTWRDLRMAGLLCATSIALGLLAIR